MDETPRNFEELYKQSLVVLDQKGIEIERKNRSLGEMSELNKKLKTENKALIGTNHELRQINTRVETNAKGLTNQNETLGTLIGNVISWLFEHTSLRSHIKDLIRQEMVEQLQNNQSRQYNNDRY